MLQRKKKKAGIGVLSSSSCVTCVQSYDRRSNRGRVTYFLFIGFGMLWNGPMQGYLQVVGTCRRRPVSDKSNHQHKALSVARASDQTGGVSIVATMAGAFRIFLFPACGTLCLVPGTGRCVSFVALTGHPLWVCVNE
jgi:hypothetical protein